MPQGTGGIKKWNYDIKGKKREREPHGFRILKKYVNRNSYHDFLQLITKIYFED